MPAMLASMTAWVRVALLALVVTATVATNTTAGKAYTAANATMASWSMTCGRMHPSNSSRS